MVHWLSDWRFLKFPFVEEETIGYDEQYKGDNKILKTVKGLYFAWGIDVDVAFIKAWPIERDFTTFLHNK